MALFKPYSGTSAELAQVPVHDGYAYFTTDDSKLSVDINGTRYSANAKNADGLVDGDGSLTADGIKSLINNLSINTINITYDDTSSRYIGTLANPTDGIGDLVKLHFIHGAPTNKDTNNLWIYINNESYVITNTLGMLQEEDQNYASIEYLAFYSDVNADNLKIFTVLDLKVNLTEDSFRNKINVYSKTEVDNKLADINVETYKPYTITVSSSGWTTDGTTGKYKYVYTNTALKCGSDGNIAPIISYENDSTSPVSSAALDDYAKIYNAVCTAGVGITFYANAAITNSLTLKILDPQ